MHRMFATIIVGLVSAFFIRPVFAADASPEEGGKNTGAITINIGVSRTPAALPLLRMDETEALGGALRMKVDIWTGPEQLLAMVQAGRHQMFTLPLTMVAKLHNKNVGIRLTNVNTWGVTYFVTTDPSIREWGDLRGKEIFVPQKTSPPDALTQFFLGRAGLSPGRDVNLVYAAVSEIAQLLKAGRISCATLIEPQATAAMLGNASARIAFDLEEEWKKAHGPNAATPTIGFGGLPDFLDANRDLVVLFEREYAKALEWVLANPAEAGGLAEKRLGLRSEVVAKAVPNFGLAYKSAIAAKPELDAYFRWLIEFSPAIIGETVPDETLYWQ